MKTTKAVNLDINKKKYDFISAKQGDNARYLLFRILDNGVPFSLQGKIVKVFAIKPDGKKVFNNTNIIDSEKGLVEVQLTTQMLAVDGILRCELTIFENGEILSTMPFEIDIIISIRDENAILSTNEFSVLMNVIENGKTLTESLKPIVSEAKPLYENLKPVVDEAKPLNETFPNVVNEAKETESKLKEIVASGNLDNYIKKVEVPTDKDCNLFKKVNVFCVFDTGAGDFKNTPEGTLLQGSCRVFILINRGYSDGRFQQEFINVYPQDRTTRYIRNFNADGNGNWGTWWKVYDEANRPTPSELKCLGGMGVLPIGTDLNNILDNGCYEVSEISKCVNGIQGIYDWGTIIVFNTNLVNTPNGQRITQIYYPHVNQGGKRIPYYRVKDGGNWTEWFPVTYGLNANDVNAISKNGDGEIKGKLTVNQLENKNPWIVLATGSDGRKFGSGIGEEDMYLHNSKANTYFQLKNDGRLCFNGKEVCDRGHFTGDLGLNGYQMFPTGLLVQWGYVDMGKDTTKLVNFPKSFKDNNYNLQVSVYGGPGRVPTVKTYYAKNNNFYIQCEAGFSVYWEAKGSV